MQDTLIAGGRTYLPGADPHDPPIRDILIRDGRIAEPVKGATLIGDGPTVLTRVKGIANDLELDEGVGVCGKGGQSVPAGVGQPTLLVDGLTVGGTAA